jgi:hypothetical protein
MIYPQECTIYKIVTEERRPKKRFYESTKQFDKYWKKALDLAKRVDLKVTAYKYVVSGWILLDEYPKSNEEE